VLLGYGLGVANLVARATASARELEPAELHEGAELLATKVRRYAPRMLAIAGVGAYRTGFDQPATTVGPQALRVGGRPVGAANPSGLNAHYQLPDLVAEFRRLRDEAGHGPGNGLGIE
jgi:TDG/mug DNA glycosylase family protein